MNDPFDLNRFVDAQRGAYEAALAEIGRGAKRGHWMWFIFPQFAGLGVSAMSRRYAIRSLAEACAYLDHPLLGPRLRACVAALPHSGDASADHVFGPVDAMKLRSSLTLFAALDGDPAFAAALDMWFGGERDVKTLAFIADGRAHD